MFKSEIKSRDNTTIPINPWYKYVKKLSFLIVIPLT